MKLTTKGRFAVTAMLDLAMHETDSPVTLTAISARQSISLSYLEQLFSQMRRKGLVKSVRGPGGGYLSAQNHKDITVKNIVTAVDEKLDSAQCGGSENCHEGGRCITHDLWVSLNTKVLDYLDGLSLQDLIDGQKDRNKTITFSKNIKKSSGIKIGAA